MNKQGWIFNFAFGLIGLFVLIMILTVLIPIQAGGDEELIYQSLDNVSKTLNERFDVKNENTPNNTIVKVTYSFINFLLYSSLEVVKAGVKYSVDHPDFINARTLLIVIIISLLIPIVYYGFMIFIIVFLLIREYYLIKKEKRLLEH